MDPDLAASFQKSERLLKEVHLLRDAIDRSNEALKQAVELKAAFMCLYKAVPALGHHEIPAYDCPARDLANAMNKASILLDLPMPYPAINKPVTSGPKEWAICGWCAGGQDDPEGKCPKCSGAKGKWIEKL